MKKFFANMVLTAMAAVLAACGGKGVEERGQRILRIGFFEGQNSRPFALNE